MNEMKDLGGISGSREPSPSVSALTGFDPGRTDLIYARATEIAFARYPSGCASASILADIVREAIAELQAEGARGHWSDCAVHNEPESRAGPCDCGGVELSAEPEKPVVLREDLPGAMGDFLRGLASGTEARSGETEGLDPKDDGPVAKPDAPKVIHDRR